MNKKLMKTGIIGFGLAGRNQHYRTIMERLGDVTEVTAIFSRSPIDRKGVGDQYSVDEETKIYSDIDDFFKSGGFETVHITVPSGLHLKFIELAASHKKNIICEKPLEVTLLKADKAIEIASHAKVDISVCFQNRFNPTVLKMKEAISDGCLGEIVCINVNCLLYRHPDYYKESSWRGTFELDGGAALMNQGIHYVDLFQWLAGVPVVGIRKGFAEKIHHSNIEAEDFAYGEIILRNGAIANILCGTCFKPGIGQSIEIKGTNGWMVFRDGYVENACWGGVDRTDYFVRKENTQYSVSSPALGLDNHTAYFREFYRAIKKGDETPISAIEARKSLEIILGIYKSAETGKFVEIPMEPTYKPGLG